MAGKREKDEFSGQYTTGHEWDGIKELDNPTPRWWLWVWLATIVWAIGYWIVLPAWPLIDNYTRGLWNYSSREAVNKDIENALAAQGDILARISASSMTEIKNDPDLSAFAFASGRSAFALYCSQCHGLGASGAPGIANLNDDDWIWGGDLENIYNTIRFGVRAENDDTRYNFMPAFGADGLLSETEVTTVSEFVLGLEGGGAYPASPGGVLFAEQCAMCHGGSGEGIYELGGPRLNDAIWLYGGSLEEIIAQTLAPKHGMMPAWEDRLSPEVIKQLAVYVHSLGGGEEN